MKAKPTGHPGEVVLELNRSDEPLMAAAANEITKAAFKIKGILVPTDFSDCAKKALQYAIPLAKEHQAALTLLYVVPPSSYVGGEFGAYDYGFEDQMRKSAEKELAKLARDEVCDEVVANTLIRAGAPAHEILEVANQWPADLIVISTHGRTGLTHVFLGSVAEQVVQRAPCPVLVVREREHDFAPPDRKEL
jgi:nucleotide-binding universal stress UspA family protein